MNIAAAFTSYDDEEEVTLDKSVGELVFNYFEWGINDDGTYYSRRVKIPSHQCTSEELGLNNITSTSSFNPISQHSLPDVQKYQKKFICIDKEDLRISGNWNTY